MPLMFLELLGYRIYDALLMFSAKTGSGDAHVHGPPGRHDEPRDAEAQPEQAPISAEQVRQHWSQR